MEKKLSRIYDEMKILIENSGVDLITKLELDMLIDQAQDAAIMLEEEIENEQTKRIQTHKTD